MGKDKTDIEDIELIEQKQKLHQIIDTFITRFKFGERIYGYPLHDELEDVEMLKEKLNNAKDFYEVDEVELKLFELEQQLPPVLK